MDIDKTATTADDDAAMRALEREAQELANKLGAIQLEDPLSRAVKTAHSDLRMAQNVRINASNEQEFGSALAAHYGFSEAVGIRQHDFRWLMHLGGGSKSGGSWQELALYMEHHHLLEMRPPHYWFRPFRALMSRDGTRATRTQDDEAEVRYVVGISPQGWCAALASRPSSRSAHLVWTSVRMLDSEGDQRAWVQHPCAPKFSATALPTCSSIDWNVASLYYEDTRTLHIVDLELEPSRGTCVVRLSDYTDVPPVPVVQCMANIHYALLVHEQGQLTVLDYHNKINYTLVLYARPVPTTRTDVPNASPLPPPPVVNPITNEPLDTTPPPPENVDEAALPAVHHRICAVAFNELRLDSFVVSSHLGWVCYGDLAEPGTATVPAIDYVAKTLVFVEMGSRVSLADTTSARTPTQEPARGLCLRSVRGGDVMLAQCGMHHLSYRCDAVRELEERTGALTPRISLTEMLNTGPWQNVGVCGTTIVAHARNNHIMIGTLAVAPERPGAQPVRYRVTPFEGRGAPTAAPQSGRHYRSLSVSTNRVYCLMPNGLLVCVRPTSEHERAQQAAQEQEAEQFLAAQQQQQSAPVTNVTP